MTMREIVQRGRYLWKCVCTEVGTTVFVGSVDVSVKMQSVVLVEVLDLSIHDHVDVVFNSNSLNV